MELTKVLSLGKKVIGTLGATAVAAAVYLDYKKETN